MKISIIQPDIAWESKTINLRKLVSLISPLFNKTDIVILPEMFNTGFSMNTQLLCEAPQSETYKWMKDIAEKGNFGVCGSYIVKENMHFFNRWVFVTPGDELWSYDKRHLFRMGGEDKVFSPGNKRVVLNFRGLRISPYICYDLRFPVWSRSRSDYDLIVYVANWPEARRETWLTLLKARAIENQCYVAGANRTGTDGNGINYCGSSVIINPRGEILAEAGYDSEATLTAEISLDELFSFREKFPVFKDADDFSIL